MTADEFREQALSFSDATEDAHMGHPDFRAHGRIFATLGYPDASWGMVKLSPQDQKHFVDLFPQVFVPAKGAWGLQGSTTVHLTKVKPEALANALDLAWQNSAAEANTKSAKPKTARPKGAARARSKA
jgi:YjbR